MFRHVVLFTWIPDATEQQKKALMQGLSELPGKVSAIRHYHYGEDSGINPANASFAVVADFDGRDGYLEYRDHPAHRDLVVNLVNPIVATRTAVQYEL